MAQRNLKLLQTVLAAIGMAIASAVSECNLTVKVGQRNTSIIQKM